jgi:hypothetical protein
MLIPAPAINLTVPVVPGDYTTTPLELGTVAFTHPQPFSSDVVDEIILQYEHPNSGRPSPEDIALGDSLTTLPGVYIGRRTEQLYLPPTLEFFRRFNQWFVTVLVDGTGFPFAPFYLYLSHFDRTNRKVYYTRGTLTLSRVV